MPLILLHNKQVNFWTKVYFSTQLNTLMLQMHTPAGGEIDKTAGS